VGYVVEHAELAPLVASDIPHGAYVNLGIGQPAGVADHLDPAAGITLHTENCPRPHRRQPFWGRERLPSRW
jgi:acyl CoA:acetate/3-ketoacid CoA transferase beta subunit